MTAKEKLGVCMSMPLNAGIRRFVLTGAIAVVSMAWAMPTKEEIKRVQPLVNELMSEHVDAYKANKKTAKEVGDAALGLVKVAEGEAAKCILLKGAIYYYSRARDFERVADVLDEVSTQIKDVPASEMESLAAMALANAKDGEARRLRNMQQAASDRVAAEKEIASFKSELRRNGYSETTLRGLADAYVRAGNWPKALKVFAKLDVKAAVFELGQKKDPGGCDALKAADYWWDYKTKNDTPYRIHAAALYRKALYEGLAEGLKEVLVKKRLAEVEALVSPKAAAESKQASVRPAALSAARGDRNPLYCVIDLSAGPNARKYPISYLSAEPKGGWTDKYKTTNLVLRRIEPGSFIMGWKQKVEANRVTFKRPFYIGVFEVTQKQYALVTGQKPSKYPGEMRPLDTISWEKLRGPASVHNWPEVNTVASDSFIGRIRARTGLDGFDLPTQAQWEYACRAGTTTDRYDGSKYTRDKMWRDSIDHCYRLGRCAVNQKLKGYKEPNWVKHNPDGKGGFYEASTIVGMYPPNPWGLYDMYGNVMEMCLSQKYDSWGKDGERPTGKIVQEGRALCGEPWDEPMIGSARSFFVSPSRDCAADVGFRLALWPD
ncbi:MAG: SUMF1/EgtB/PvdO family nonheme iron enzyme [Kiritimatiellae bacterium]|nr:SUMF1/EgtB/PvdO family nonheme iron enzyme [Kiritimatiellia bacterium]